MAPIPTAFPVYLTGHDSKALSGAIALAGPPVHLFDTLTPCLGKQMVPALRALHHSYCKLPALNRIPGKLTSLQQSPLPRMFCYYLSIPPQHGFKYLPGSSSLNIYLDS